MQLEFTRERYTEMAKAKAKPAARWRSLKSRIAKRKSAGQKGTGRKTATKSRVNKMELRHVPWHTIDLEDLNPLLQRQFVVGHDIMVARVLMKKGCIIPLHSHYNEQFTYILEGALKFEIDGRDIVVHAGEVLCIPSNMPHKAIALEDTVDLDVFTPPRADWLGKTDQYLRR